MIACATRLTDCASAGSPDGGAGSGACGGAGRSAADPRGQGGGRLRRDRLQLVGGGPLRPRAHALGQRVLLRSGGDRAPSRRRSWPMPTSSPGSCWLLALLLRGPTPKGRSVASGSGWWRSRRPGRTGGRYTYACAEGLSAACRSMEWHLRLPVHHYVHVVSGIAEFATLTVAAAAGCPSHPGPGDHAGTALFGVSGPPCWSATPSSGSSIWATGSAHWWSHISSSLFSLMVLTEVFEPIGARRTAAHGPNGSSPGPTAGWGTARPAVAAASRLD